MKHEWKKAEKTVYLPGRSPALVEIPPVRCFSLSGTGDPNGEAFGEAIGVLYALSYGLKMLPRQGVTPPGYAEYALYPLEAVWAEADGMFSATGDKSALRYDVMIRQPDFCDEALAAEVLERVRAKKPHALLDAVRYGEWADGLCVQLLHLGPYDDEPQSCARMDAFCAENKLRRRIGRHREIYLGDPRRTAPDKLRTVLRYGVEPI